MKVYYTDGSCRGKNQKGVDNVGGWGGVCFANEEEECILAFESDTEANTTNNRQELKGLLWALNHAKEHFPSEKCVIFSDSSYAVTAYNEWIHSWSKKNWQNSKKQTVENLDLVLELWEFAKEPFSNISVKHTAGHVGTVGNELVDALATGKHIRFDTLVRENFIDFDLLDSF